MNRLTVCLLCGALSGCIKAPEIVMVDRATALEQQAGGTYEDLECDLAQEATGPHPVPLTPKQLEALGILPVPLVDHTDETRADRIDALLRQRCIGEGNDGLLVDTHDDCIGASDLVVAVSLIDQTNRGRVQLWDWMHAAQPHRTVEELRSAWVVTHAQGVVCRGWIQKADGTWEPKKC